MSRPKTLIKYNKTYSHSKNIQIEIIHRTRQLNLALVQEQVFVLFEIFRISVLAEVGDCVFVDGHFRDEDKQLLTACENLLRKGKQVVDVLFGKRTL